jgi:O-antigen ligase
MYLGFFIPALAAVLLNARELGRALASDWALLTFTLLLLWFGITTLWSSFENPGHLIKLLLMLWLLVLAVRLMLGNMRLFNISMSLSLVVVAGIVTATVYEYLGGTGAGFYNWRLDHLGGRTMSAVSVGEISAIFMLYCLMQARLAATPSLRTGFTVMAVIFLLALLLSFSRTAFLALFLTALWYYLQRGNIRAVLMLATITVLLLILMLLDLDAEWLSNISRSSTVDIRLWGWQASLEKIREHWLLGYGMRSAFAVALDDPRYIEIGEPFWHPHNVFLSVWYQAGLIGLALLLALLALLMRKLRPLLEDPQTLYWSCIFIFVLLICLVDNPTLIDRPAEPWIWFWLPLAVALSGDKISPVPGPP